MVECSPATRAARVRFPDDAINFADGPTSPGFMLLVKSTDQLLCLLQTDADKREAKTFGDGGYRSPYLSHAKRALYHLSYVPRTVRCCTKLGVSHPKLKVILGELRVAYSVDLSPAAVHNPR